MTSAWLPVLTFAILAAETPSRRSNTKDRISNGRPAKLAGAGVVFGGRRGMAIIRFASGPETDLRDEDGATGDAVSSTRELGFDIAPEAGPDRLMCMWRSIFNGLFNTPEPVRHFLYPNRLIKPRSHALKKLTLRSRRDSRYSGYAGLGVLAHLYYSPAVRLRHRSS